MDLSSVMSFLSNFGVVITSNGKLFGAFIVGFLGSVAYITALYFKFIGSNEENRRIIMEPFFSKEAKVSKSKCFWYGFIGGSVATVFQFDVPNFVAIQSLILGATWPAVVAQFLSGRLSEPTQDEKLNIARHIIDEEKRLAQDPEKQTDADFQRRINDVIRAQGTASRRRRKS